jgi:hypothetical protein
VRSFGALWPQIAARRTFSDDGRPTWEFRFTPRVVSEPAVPVAVSSHESDPVPGSLFGRDSAVRKVAAHAVSSRAVHIDDDLLRIDEFESLTEHPVVDFGQLVDRTDIAVALVELAADPENDVLRGRVISRLAVARGWFQNAPRLEISSARIHGEGFGGLLEGVFIWRACGADAVVTYVVTPGQQAKDLLKADPDLVRALLRCACPRPEDTNGELRNLLSEAMTRLGELAASSGAVSAPVDAGVVDVPAVLEVKGRDGATSVPPPYADPEALGRAGRRASREKSESERALSDELAQLARKVGTAAVRPASGHPA